MAIKQASAGAVLYRKSGEILYLILHYPAGHWDFPKGHIEKGEDEPSTVKREIEEETGINDIEIKKDFKESIHYFFMQEGKRISKDVHFYLAETKTEKVELSDEHVGYEWLTYEEALERLTYKNAKKVLEKANDDLIDRR